MRLKTKKHNLILRTFIKAQTERTLSSYLPTDAGPRKTSGLVTCIRHRSVLMQEPRTESEASHTSGEYTHSVHFVETVLRYGDCPFTWFIVKSLALCSRPSASRAGGRSRLTYTCHNAHLCVCQRMLTSLYTRTIKAICTNEHK